MTNKQRMLTAMRGGAPDAVPFAPRLDLWFSANQAAGSLPQRYRNCTHHFEVARAEGWALHQINPAYQQTRKPEDNLHWALGVLSYRETVFGYRFGGEVEIEIRESDERTRVIYRTPFGTVSTAVLYTQAMRRAGISNFMIEEHAIKGPADYKAVAYIFEHLELYPDWSDFETLQQAVGQDGVAFTMAGRAASPMHHIQKYFIDATDFFLHYTDYPREINELAGSLERFFQQLLDIVAESPAEAVFWGANFDDMLTYPAYFEKDILPWIRRASETLGPKGIIVSCHCDGENRGLMDLIRDSGMHVAESVCPYPMTKVPIEEYYARWADKLTIFGGIPSILLLEETTSEEDFEAYLDRLFKAVAPGRRMIFGVADSTPPGAIFQRLVRLGERIAVEARIPMEAGAVRPLTDDDLNRAARKILPEFTFDAELSQVQRDVLDGDHLAIVPHIKALLEREVDPSRILHQGMLAAMELIGERFKTGEVFIPEVLRSARAMNAATRVLEPHLTETGSEKAGRILIGTVRGDLHDIGKNLVAAMLRGVGFDIQDAGINVPAQEFVRQVAAYKPDIVGLSALLTTTMPEMKTVIESLRQAGLREKVKIMVGGAPLNRKFALDIGADGYAADAGDAVTLAKKLLEDL